MIHRDELTDFVYWYMGKDLMKKALATDAAANGVQFTGGIEVKKIALES